MSLASAALYSAGGADANRGLEIWDRNCQGCHGESGLGDGPANQVLPARPPSLLNSKYTKSAESFAAYLVKNSPVASLRQTQHYTAKISGEELDKLVYFFMDLKKQPANRPPTYSNPTYAKACIYCHGFYADGKGIISSFTNQPFDFRSRKAGLLNQALWKIKLAGSQKKLISMRGSNPHFFRKLSAAEQADLLLAIQGFSNNK